MRSLSFQARCWRCIFRKSKAEGDATAVCVGEEQVLSLWDNKNEKSLGARIVYECIKGFLRENKGQLAICVSGFVVWVGYLYLVGRKYGLYLGF